MLSRLQFDCDTLQQAEGLLQTFQAELAAVQGDAVPTVVMGSCCGIREVKLNPWWCKGRVARADPMSLVVESTIAKQGKLYRLLIEISG